MRIGELARQLGSTPEAIRYYERNGLLPEPARTANGYRDYTDRDVSRLRLLIGLRELDLPLEQAASLACMCTDGHCVEVTAELREVLAAKRGDVAHRMDDLRFLDGRLAHLAGQLEDGASERDSLARQVVGDGA